MPKQRREQQQRTYPDKVGKIDGLQQRNNYIILYLWVKNNRYIGMAMFVYNEY